MNLRLPFSAAYVRVIYIHLYPRVSILRIADHDRIVLNGAACFIDISESRLSRFCGSRTESLIVSCQPSRCCPSRTHSFRRLVLWSARYRLHTWHHLLIVPPHIIMHASKRDLLHMHASGPVRRYHLFFLQFRLFPGSRANLTRT